MHIVFLPTLPSSSSPHIRAGEQSRVVHFFLSFFVVLVESFVFSSSSIEYRSREYENTKNRKKKIQKSKTTTAAEATPSENQIPLRRREDCRE